MSRSRRVGIVFDRFGDSEPPRNAPADWDVEYEPEETILTIEDALRRAGHEPVRIGNVAALVNALRNGSLNIDAAVNIAESYGSRNREAHAPVLLELAGIPFVGSDALALSATLDKHLTKLVTRQLAVQTPDWILVRVGEDSLPDDVSLPAIVKPRYEGTAKGILPSSRCESIADVLREVERQHGAYGQDVIVERFVDGAEYTVAVAGHPCVALPVLQRAVERSTGIGLHAVEASIPGRDALEFDILGILTPELELVLQELAIRVHNEFDCRDFSRSDFRVDAAGDVWFIEINPLPTFAPDGTFAIIAELSGQSYPDFLTRILSDALQRVG